MEALSIIGLVLAALGGGITVIFWIPRIVNRPRLRELLGERYRLIYLVYIANGPMLVVLGLLLYFLFGQRCLPSG